MGQIAHLWWQLFLVPQKLFPPVSSYRTLLPFIGAWGIMGKARHGRRASLIPTDIVDLYIPTYAGFRTRGNKISKHSQAKGFPTFSGFPSFSVEVKKH